MNEGIDRRRRFISTVACALGIGVIINPGWATDNLWPTYDGMSTGKRAIRYRLAMLVMLPQSQATCADELALQDPVTVVMASICLVLTAMTLCL